FFGSAILLWWRRRCTLVYNVEPALLDEAMNQAFARVGLSTVRIGNRILFQPLPSEKKQELTEAVQATPGGALRRSVSVSAAVQAEALTEEGANAAGHVLGEVELDPFIAMRNVTMRWRSDRAGLRRDVEAEVARVLAEVETVDNPAAGWLLTISSCL